MTNDTVRDLRGALAGLVVVLAASGALTRVFVDRSWVPATVLAIVAATAVAVGARRLRLPAPLAAIVSVVGLVVLSYVLHLESGPLVPGGAQFDEFRELVSTGLTQLRDEPAPTIPLDGIMVVVTSGSWVVAHLVHELTVRLRRPGLGAALATILWAVPLAVPLPAGRTWPQTLPFLLAVALLLLAESDVDLDGVTRDRAGPLLPTTGIAVALAAVVTAGLFPALLPGYRADPWIDVGNGSDPRGYQPIVDIGDRLRLPGDRDVLEYDAASRVYLRLAALDNFDGTTWRLGPANQPTFRPSPEDLTRATSALPPETALGTTTPVDVDVRVLDLENIYVPVPYQPLRVTGDAASGMVYSRVGGFVATADLSDNEIGGRLVTGVTPGLAYRVEAAVPSPDPAELRDLVVDPATVRPWLELPGDYREYGELAERVYRESGATSNIDKALALQAFFIGPDSSFGYSTDVPALRGSGALREFVFGSQQGYCEYFATAMAVMLRASGVPARVSVGFLGGQVTTPADLEAGRPLDTYTVSTADAHAWVEVLFPGSGWVRFEPTPRTDGQVQVPTIGDLTPDQTRREQDQAAAQPDVAFDEPVPDVPTDVPTDEAPQPDQPVAAPAGERQVLPAIAILVLVLTSGAIAVAARRGRRTPPDRDPVERVLTAQRELLRAAASLGLRPPQATTIREASRAWVDDGRVDRHAAADFAALAQAAAFGGELTDEDARLAEQRAARLGAELGASVDTRDRVLAPARLPLEKVGETGRALVTSARQASSRFGKL